MASIKMAFGTKTSFTITLTSLANGSARESTVVDLSSSLEEDMLIRVKANGSAAGNTGPIDFYVYSALGDTTYTDGATGTDAAFTAANIKNAKFLDSVVLNGTTIQYAIMRGVRAAFGGTMPNKIGLIALNASGAALSSTSGDFAVEYQTVYRTVA